MEMQSSAPRAYTLATALLIYSLPSTMFAGASDNFQLSNAAFRLVVASNFCTEIKSLHTQAELSVRLGTYESWKLIFAKKIIDSGAGVELTNEFFRYLDGVFKDGARSFDNDICQAFAYTGFSADYWQKDLRDIVKIDAAELKFLDDEGVHGNIERVEEFICIKASEFWQWDCPNVKY